MNRWLPLALLPLVLLSADRAAAQPEAEADAVERPEEEAESIGRELPELEFEPGARAAARQAEEFAHLEFSPQVHRGAGALGMEPAFVQAIHEGLEKLYKRDYAGARAHFEQTEQSYPGTGVAAVGQTLIWQALMLENFDFKYEQQWEVASQAAEESLRAQLEQPGNEGWEHFLLAGVVGIESIHLMRRERYLPALRQAFEAMDHIARAKRAAPDFVDLRLADGMYNYWRTVVTMNSKVLPDFGDHRAEGIEHMQYVENAGVFLAQPTTLAMAFTWIEEREFKKALTSCLRNRRGYPDNVINNLLLGRVYLYLGKPDSALRTFDEVIEDAPDNHRVRYYRGLALQRSGNFEAARDEFQRYLGVDYMEDYQRAAAHYRLGQVHRRLGDDATAQIQFKAAVKLNKHKGAKAALERLHSGG